MKKIPLLFLLPCFAAFAETVVINEDGLYISGDRIEAGPGVYVVSGSFNYKGDDAARVLLGLGAYDVSGGALHSENYFALPTEKSGGLLELASFDFAQKKEFPFKLRVTLEGEGLSHVAFALDVCMPDGAVLQIDDLSMVPESADDSGESEDPGSADGQNGSDAVFNGRGGKKTLAHENAGETLQDAQGMEQAMAQASGVTGLGTVFVSGDTGNDSNSGKSFQLAKATIGSAMNVPGTSVVEISESATAYLADSLSAPSGTTLVLRPRGSVVLRGSMQLNR